MSPIEWEGELLQSSYFLPSSDSETWQPSDQACLMWNQVFRRDDIFDAEITAARALSVAAIALGLFLLVAILCYANTRGRVCSFSGF